MQTSRLSAPMHAIVAEHLAGEFATAGLTLESGSTLVLTGIGPFDEQTVAATVFGDEPCSFDPADVREVSLTVVDPRMMAPSELIELGLLAPGPKPTLPRGSSPLQAV